MGQELVNGGSDWLAPMLSAAAVAAVVIAGVGLSQLDLDVERSRGTEPPVGPDQAIREITHATNGRVAEVFTCPATIPYNFGSGDSALEGVALAGPRALADEMGASRFELLGGPEATVLRLGNEDGSLASLNTMHRTPDGWILDDMTACYGGENLLVPTSNHAELGVHGAEPWPAEDVIGSRPGVLVDDREYYNAAGVIQHRSLYGFPCGVDVCFAATADTEEMLGEFVRGDGVPKDLTSMFLPEEQLRDRPPPYSFLAVYDRGDEIARVAWEPSRGGMLQWAEPVDGPWTGQLFLLLAQHDPDATVHVHPRDGRVRVYDARGYAVP